MFLQTSFGCGAPATRPVDSADDTLSSGETQVELGELTVSATAKPTVFRVSWPTTGAATGRVDCGTDGDFGHSTDAVASAGGTEHEALLLLAEGESWTCHAVWTHGDEETKSADFGIETAYAPAEMPGLSLTEPGAADLGGFLLVVTALEGASWVAIVDRLGRRLWWEQGARDAVFSEVALSPDGRSLVWNSTGGDGELHVASLDGSSHLVLPQPGLHHGFAALPEGGYVSLRYDIRSWEGVDVIGDRVVEIDDQGEITREVWSVFQDFPVEEAEVPTDVRTYDYSHANSIALDPDGELYLVSFYALDAVVAIDRASGERRWTVGGEHSDLALAGEAGDGFSHQHSPRLVDGDLMIFNNRDPGAVARDQWSEAVRYDLDLEGGQYARTWSWDADKTLFVPALGNADPQPDGSVLVAWGTAGRAVQVNTRGDVLWQVDADLGGPFGFVHLVEEIAGSRR